MGLEAGDCSSGEAARTQQLQPAAQLGGWPPPSPARCTVPLLAAAGAAAATAGLFSKEVIRRNTVLLYVSSDDATQVSRAQRVAASLCACWAAGLRVAIASPFCSSAGLAVDWHFATLRPLQVIAYIVYTTHGLGAHIAKLAVREDLRRQGLGRSLVQVRGGGGGWGWSLCHDASLGCLSQQATQAQQLKGLLLSSGTVAPAQLPEAWRPALSPVCKSAGGPRVSQTGAPSGQLQPARGPAQQAGAEAVPVSRLPGALAGRLGGWEAGRVEGWGGVQVGLSAAQGEAGFCAGSGWLQRGAATSRALGRADQARRWGFSLCGVHESFAQVEAELPDYYAPGRSAHKMRLEFGDY